MISLLAERTPHTPLENGIALTIACLFLLIWGRLALHSLTNYFDRCKPHRKARSSRRSSMAFSRRG
jgi:hypothetical protein